MSIWKFPFQVSDFLTISMPLGANILSIQVQRDVPTIWAMVNPNAQLVTRSFRCFGTGHPIPSGLPLEFVGTVQMFDGELVFHVFEDLP